MKPIVDMRVIQTVNWVKDDSAGWLRIPVGYELQILREGSEEWENLPIILNEIPNPDKEEEDGAGGE